MTESDYIADICKKEIMYSFYEHKINGISIYNYIKREIRSLELKRFGYSQNFGKSPISLSQLVKSFFISLRQIFVLLLLNKKSTFFIYSFFRTDCVYGIYMDKFTDPLIDYTILRDDFIIFDRGNNSNHRKPRQHLENIIYTDSINYISYVWSYLFVKLFKTKNKTTFDNMWKSVNQAFPNIIYNKSSLTRTIYYMITLTNVYEFIFRRMNVKYMLAPARHTFLPLIPSAKRNGIKVLEVQHGITYSESLTYSGYRDIDFSPDLFLSFGEMNPKGVYGIDENKIINIGWAFGKFIKEHEQKERREIRQENTVLVISEPHITDNLLRAISILAVKNPGIVFYFRPHPLERLTVQQKELIDNTDNIKMDDNTQNILTTLTCFKTVIGENSTVLYEALSMGKRVGKVCMEGLEPLYLQKEDEKFFGRIYDCDSFKAFWEDEPTFGEHKSIYAPFNKDCFEKILYT